MRNEKIAAVLGSGGCFVAGTAVQMAPAIHPDQRRSSHPSRSRGSRNRRVGSTVKQIEQVHAGDLVQSRDPHTGRTGAKRVLRTSRRVVPVVVVLTLANGKTGTAVETITATRNHPFYVTGKGFVPAGGLAVGNAIVTRAGPALVVKAIQWKRRAEGYTVYNFEVEDNHTYFVGDANGGAVVHNGPIDCVAAAKALRAAEPIGSALKADKYHLSATFMREEAALHGTHTATVGGDGVQRTLTQILGNFDGVEGRFEYIVDPNGNLVHQMFVRGGTLNGVPIKP